MTSVHHQQVVVGCYSCDWKGKRNDDWEDKFKRRCPDCGQEVHTIRPVQHREIETVAIRIEGL